MHQFDVELFRVVSNVLHRACDRVEIGFEGDEFRFFQQAQGARGVGGVVRDGNGRALRQGVQVFVGFGIQTHRFQIRGGQSPQFVAIGLVKRFEIRPRLEGIHIDLAFGCGIV